MLFEKPDKYDLDLGHEHYLQFVANRDDERLGAIIYHPVGSKPYIADQIRCGGSIFFDVPAARAFAEHDRQRPLWQVQSMDPLTILPSVLCECGDHGFIREGRRVPA